MFLTFYLKESSWIHHLIGFKCKCLKKPDRLSLNNWSTGIGKSQGVITFKGAAGLRLQLTGARKNGVLCVDVATDCSREARYLNLCMCVNSSNSQSTSSIFLKYSFLFFPYLHSISPSKNLICISGSEVTNLQSLHIIIIIIIIYNNIILLINSNLIKVCCENNE